MPLVSLESVETLVVSPCCSVPLVRRRCSRCGVEFPTTGPWPVLVDFAHSVLKRDAITASQGASVVIRRQHRGVEAVVRRCLKVHNKVAEANLSNLLARLSAGARVLVVGGGAIGDGMTRLYAAETNLSLVAFDIYGSENVQLIADAHRIPFADGAFSAVVVQAVLEHVLDPSVVVAEIWRVLEPNGYVYAETPFLQNVHEGAYDFTRFTESGHRWLFRAFKLISSGPSNGPGSQLIWSISYFVWGITRSRKAARVARALLSPLQLCDHFIPRRFHVDSAAGVFFLGSRSDSPIVPADIVSFYSGAQ